MSKDFKFTDSKFRLTGYPSRYNDHRIVEEDGILTQETWTMDDIPEDDDDKYIRIAPFLKWRLDLLALKYYGNQMLWWVIAHANDIIDPFMTLNSPSAPLTLRIPSPKIVRRYLK